MLSDAELHNWAPGSDPRKIRRVEQGVLALVERRSGRKLTSPATQVEWDFSVGEHPTGGLSGFAGGELQTLYLPEYVNRTLSGTVTVAANGTDVTGVSTLLSTQLDGFIADKTCVEIESERLLVSAVPSETSLTLNASTPHVAGATAKPIKADVIWAKVRSPGGIAWTNLDCRYVQVSGRAARFAGASLPVGDDTVRTRVNFGWAEDEGPDDVMMLLGEMVQEWYKRQGGRGSVTRVSKSGVSVTWSSMGARAKDFMERATGLRRPMRYAA